MRGPGSGYLRGLGRSLSPDDDADEAVQRRREAVIERLRTGWTRREAPELEVVQNDYGSDVFPVAGEILAATATWDDIQTEEGGAGLEVVPLGHPELEGRVVRLRQAVPGTNEDVRELVRSLQGRGHAVSMSYVTPLGGRPIMKPNSGEFAPQVADFPAYQAAGPRYGEGVVVAVIDTGVTQDPRSDGWLADVPRVAHDDASTAHDDSNIDPLDAEPRDGWLDVYAGHGTFVAGVVARVAPGAEIRVYKAVGPGGAGCELDVASALIRAVRDGAHVVNLSLGTQTLFGEASVPLGVALDVVREIEDERGSVSVIVASAGNYGDAVPTYPAAFGRVVAVGGLTAELRPTTWSSRGPWVDISTVGEDVVSTYVEGRQNPAFGSGAEFGENPFARWVGTSFAAPQVAGAIARTMTELGVSGPEAVNALLAAGKPVAGFGKALQILPGA
ncbi:S8 family peptidase [Cellulomonas sp. S1-8]|uniref:S8 family peptidase n=1 Tax=Cellulomonas sp. S1-8 TaxID=2904790 RepID=UPI002243A127|nr:S8 family serine peptidase [Cellulomonas sp. S1-8]UZN02275.1 S8 family serine peptidase [Cellulomonas sp. S1-8]